VGAEIFLTGYCNGQDTKQSHGWVLEPARTRYRAGTSSSPARIRTADRAACSLATMLIKICQKTPNRCKMNHMNPKL
jgi:hypothetical protein